MEPNKKLMMDLCYLLKSIYNNRNFIIGVLTYLSNNENMKKMIDFIVNYPGEINSDQISLYALELSKEDEFNNCQTIIH